MKNKINSPEKYKGSIFFRIILVITMLFILLSIHYCIRYICGSSMAGLHSIPENFYFFSDSRAKIAVLSFIAVLLEIVVIFYFLFSLNRFITKSSERTVRITGIILWALMIVLQLCIIFSINSAPNGDAFRVINRAYALATGEIKPMHYDRPTFRRYSNNDFYLMLMTGFFRTASAIGIGRSCLYRILIIINTACTDLGILFAVKTVGITFGKKSGTIFLAFAALNPLYYLVNFWVYTNTASILPMMLTVYLLVVFEKKRSGYSFARQLLFMVITGFVAAIAYSIRATAFFPVIAYLVLRIILLIRRSSDRWHILLTAVLVISSAIFITGASHISAAYNPDKSGNYPVVHWLKIGGCGNGSIDPDQLADLDSIQGKDAKARYDMQILRNEISKRGIHGNLIFYMHKTALTWSKAESDYQTCIMPFANSDKTLNSFLLGNRRYIVTIYMYAYRLILLLSALAGGIYLFLKKAGCLMQTIVYTIFGGYVFYTFWEGKPSYSFPFLIILAIMAVPMFSYISDRDWHCKKRSCLIIIDIRTATVFGIVCIIAMTMCQEIKLRRIHYSFQQSIYAITDNKTIYRIVPGSSLTQEFSPAYGFNHIAILTDNARNHTVSDYSFTITSNGRTVVSDPRIQVNDNFVILDFNEQKPHKGQQYTLTVTNAGRKKKIRWMTEYTRSFDLYKGQTTVNGKKSPGDLEMIVSRK